MYALRRPLLVVVVTTLCGCAPETSPPAIRDLRAVDPGPMDPALGVQFEGPEFELQPGEEKMLCWVPDFARDRDLRIQQFVGFQGAVGHHVVAMKATRPMEPGSSFDCTNIAQMANLAPFVLPDPAPGTSFLPAGFYVKLGVDDSIVLQSHYVNYTPDAIVVRDFARFFTLPDTVTDAVEASYLIVNRASMRIEPGSSSLTTTCTVDAETKILATLGHMHELGSSFKLERIAPTTDTLYSIDAWTADMRDKPPVDTYAPAEPLVLHAGDQLQLTCEWNNTRDHAVGFPEEMCTSVSAYFPARADGVILCEQ